MNSLASASSETVYRLFKYHEKFSRIQMIRGIQCHSNSVWNSVSFIFHEKFSTIQIPCGIQCASYSIWISVQFRFHVLISVNQIPCKFKQFQSMYNSVIYSVIQYQICIYTMRNSVCCKLIHLWISEYWTRFEM
jgi:hypothetical protein